jgi:hypothetical protein
MGDLREESGVVRDHSKRHRGREWHELRNRGLCGAISGIVSLIIVREKEERRCRSLDSAAREGAEMCSDQITSLQKRRNSQATQGASDLGGSGMRSPWMN